MNPARPTRPSHRFCFGSLSLMLLSLPGMAFVQPQTTDQGTNPQSNPPQQATEPSEATIPEPSEDQEGITECVITLRSGRTITGELVRQDSRIVVIGIEGIETTFLRKNVERVVVLAPVAERYEELRATIADDDIDARLALVEWLRARKAYSLASDELESILEIDPTNKHADLLFTWLKEYRKLNRSGPSSKTESPENSEKPHAASTKRTYQIRANDLEPLAEDQINLMRVYEIDLRNPPKLRVPDEVITELMERFPDSFSPDEDQRNATFNLSEIDKLKLLFSLKARDLYARVEVLENPSSIRLFKEQVHNGRGWLINACASTRCHGGVDAGSFRLINTKPNSDETALSNLYIIENTTLSNGTPLIDYNDPDRSPLLQMGMVQSKALIPHPEIPRGYPGMGYRPIFRTTRDRKYQQAIEWIRSMYQPRPEYGFDYPPPTPETQPKTDHQAP